MTFDLKLTTMVGQQLSQLKENESSPVSPTTAKQIVSATPKTHELSTSIVSLARDTSPRSLTASQIAHNRHQTSNSVMSMASVSYVGRDNDEKLILSDNPVYTENQAEEIAELKNRMARISDKNVLKLFEELKLKLSGNFEYMSILTYLWEAQDDIGNDPQPNQSLKDIIESCFRMQGGALNYYIGILSDVLTSCEDTFAKEEQLRIIKEQEIQKSKEVEKTEKPKENGPNGIESNKIKAIVRLDNALRLFRETHHQHGNYKELVQELVVKLEGKCGKDGADSTCLAHLHAVLKGEDSFIDPSIVATSSLRPFVNVCEKFVLTLQGVNNITEMSVLDREKHIANLLGLESRDPEEKPEIAQINENILPNVVKEKSVHSEEKNLIQNEDKNEVAPLPENIPTEELDAYGFSEKDRNDFVEIRNILSDYEHSIGIIRQFMNKENIKKTNVYMEKLLVEDRNRRFGASRYVSETLETNALQGKMRTANFVLFERFQEYNFGETYTLDKFVKDMREKNYELTRDMYRSMIDGIYNVFDEIINNKYGAKDTEFSKMALGDITNIIRRHKGQNFYLEYIYNRAYTDMQYLGISLDGLDVSRKILKHMKQSLDEGNLIHLDDIEREFGEEIGRIYPGEPKSRFWNAFLRTVAEAQEIYERDGSFLHRNEPIPENVKADEELLEKYILDQDDRRFEEVVKEIIVNEDMENKVKEVEEEIKQGLFNSIHNNSIDTLTLTERSIGPETRNSIATLATVIQNEFGLTDGNSNRKRSNTVESIYDSLDGKEEVSNGAGTNLLNLLQSRGLSYVSDNDSNGEDDRDTIFSTTSTELDELDLVLEDNLEAGPQTNPVIPFSGHQSQSGSLSDIAHPEESSIGNNESQGDGKDKLDLEERSSLENDDQIQQITRRRSLDLHGRSNVQGPRPRSFSLTDLPKVGKDTIDTSTWAPFESVPEQIQELPLNQSEVSMPAPKAPSAPGGSLPPPPPSPIYIVNQSPNTPETDLKNKGLTDSKNSNIEEKNEISDDIHTVIQNNTSILEEKNNIQVLNNDNNENKSSVEGTEYEDIGSENEELKADVISQKMLHMTPGNDRTHVTSDYESDSGGSVVQVSELSDPSLTYIHHRPPVLSDQGSPLPTLEQTVQGKIALLYPGNSTNVPKSYSLEDTAELMEATRHIAGLVRSPNEQLTEEQGELLRDILFNLAYHENEGVRQVAASELLELLCSEDDDVAQETLQSLEICINNYEKDENLTSSASRAGLYAGVYGSLLMANRGGDPAAVRCKEVLNQWKGVDTVKPIELVDTSRLMTVEDMSLLATQQGKDLRQPQQGEVRYMGGMELDSEFPEINLGKYNSLIGDYSGDVAFDIFDPSTGTYITACKERGSTKFYHCIPEGVGLTAFKEKVDKMLSDHLKTSYEYIPFSAPSVRNMGLGLLYSEYTAERSSRNESFQQWVERVWSSRTWKHRLKAIQLQAERMAGMSPNLGSRGNVLRASV